VGTDSFPYSLIDAFGTSAQGSVTVMISAPSASSPNVLAITPSPGAITVTIQMAGIPGLVYQIEATTDLIHWDKIGESTAGPNGLFEFTDYDANLYPNRYYRAAQ
jgi:hypothetical protein